MSKQRIFISYRRDDAQWAAGRLADSLSAHFGDDRVLRDIEDIDASARFGDTIESPLGATDAVIVLIGASWLSATDDEGRRRLDDPEDWVTQEVATALDRKLPVYPVLVDNASMPRTDELPASLQALTRHNAVSLSDSCWRDDVNRLARVISLDIPSAAERRLQWANLTIATLLYLAMALTLTLVMHNLLQQSASIDDWRVSELVNRANGDSAVSWYKRLTGSSSTVPDGSCEHPPQAWFAPLQTLQASILFWIMLPASALLFAMAHHVERARRGYFLAAAWTGAFGCMLTLVVFYPVCEQYEPVVVLYLGLLFAALMLVFMSLSGFKAK